MNVVTYDDYRSFLRDFIDMKKKSYPALTISRLAERAKIQRTYLSTVLKLKAGLSEDQLYVIGRELGLTQFQMRFLEILLALSKCQVQERQEQLRSQLEELKKQGNESSKALNFTLINPDPGGLVEYYENPLCPIVHMFLWIDKYRAKPKKLVERLGASEEKLAEAIAVLERLGLTEMTAEGYCNKEINLQLGPHSSTAKTHALLFRLLAVDVYRKRDRDDEDYFLTFTFPANEELRAKLKTAWLDLLKKFGGELETCALSDVYHLNVDFFRIR